jgi:DNA polymerase-3 subunit beta
MKITCEREKLLPAFQLAATVAPTKSLKPILANVKLEAAGEQATLTATDLEVGIRIDVPGIAVETPGTALLPVGRFGSILRESSDERLRLETDAQGTFVRGERSQFRLSQESPEEFPTVASFAEERFQEVPARLLKELIRRTAFATDPESSRYALGGVLLEMTADRITAVGTDGRRLAKMEGPAHAVGKPAEGMTIVPTRAMQLIERSVLDGDAEVQVAARGNDILVRTPRVMIYSRLVEGRFPKWRDVIPQRPSARRVELTVGPVYSALRQAAIMTSEESRGIDLTFAEGTLALAGSTAEVGQARVELPVAFDDPPLAIALDHRFFADFLKVLDPEKTFTLEMQDSDSAAVCTTEDGYAYVIMPMSRDR